MEKKKSLKKAPAKRAAEPPPRTFRLVVAYQGTHYLGWQKQSAGQGGPTVQETLEAVAVKILRKPVRLHGSGRTDSGVHARAQVAHMRAEADLPAETLLKAMNAHLPDDIRVLKLEECPPEFHAQKHVKAKTYRYFILHAPGQTPVHWPFLRPYAWFLTFPLDLARMREALKSLEGEHDFKSFQNRGTPVKDTVREILAAELIEHPPAAETLPWMPGTDSRTTLLEIRVRGRGFLKQMVRNIVGNMVEVGRGKLSLADLRGILERKDRRAGGATAPAHGLFLDHVEY